MRGSTKVMNSGWVSPVSKRRPNVRPYITTRFAKQIGCQWRSNQVDIVSASAIALMLTAPA